MLGVLLSLERYFLQAPSGEKPMEKQETTGIGWFVAGLGLGALLGVLFAPKPGKELREGLVTGAKDSKDYMATRSREAREQINTMVDRSRDQINTMVDRGRDQINEYAERGKDVVERGRERWSGLADRVAEEAGMSPRHEESEN